MSDDLPMPWGVALLMFRHQITNQLMKDHAMSPKDAKLYIDGHRNKRDDRLELIVNGLIEQHKN